MHRNEVTLVESMFTLQRHRQITYLSKYLVRILILEGHGYLYRQTRLTPSQISYVISQRGIMVWAGYSP